MAVRCQPLLIYALIFSKCINALKSLLFCDLYIYCKWLPVGLLLMKAYKFYAFITQWYNEMYF